MDAKRKDVIRRHCITVTNKMAMEFSPPPPVELPILSEKGKQLQELAYQIGGCKSALVAKMLSLVTGENLVRPGTDMEDDTRGTIRVPKFTMVVPLSNPNSHDYENGVPVLVWDASCNPMGFQIRKGRAVWGNNLPGLHRVYEGYELPSLRLATEEEINSFFSQEFHESIGEIFEDVVVIE